VNQSLTIIAAGITDLPSNIAKALLNTKIPSLASPESSPSNIPLPQLNRNDFLKVVHWTPELYNARRKNKVKGEDIDISDEDDEDGEHTPEASMSSKSSNEKVGSSWMEDEYGKPIRKSEQQAARFLARTFWNQLFVKGLAPLSHRVVSSDIRNEYIALMEHNFPWLRFCEGHWKSDQIWRDGYSNWRTKVKAKKTAAEAKAAAEGEFIDVDAVDTNSQDTQEMSLKRPRGDEETNVSKRRRVEGDKSAPPPRSVPTKRPKVYSLFYLIVCFADNI
jgi:hypothetical protein